MHENPSYTGGRALPYRSNKALLSGMEVFSAYVMLAE